jgi:hypothetical protein
MISRRVAASLAIVTTLGVGAGHTVATATTKQPAPSSRPGQAQAKATKTVSFTAKRKTVQQIDLGPAGASAGDETLIAGDITKGNVRGYTSADCVAISKFHGIGLCEVDFLLKGGTIATRASSTSKSPVQVLAVVGGTGRYADAAGSGTLQPTATGSKVTLHLK